MRFEVAMTVDVSDQAKNHLLQHFDRGERQEDLCFALWGPSTGNVRRTGIVFQIIPPKDGERVLHGNASFQPRYMLRAIDLARQGGLGLAFMHSHPSVGWQGMSGADTDAERDVLGYPAMATGLPLIGLTVGVDGFWSARFWEKTNAGMKKHKCAKVRIVSRDSHQIYFDDAIIPPPQPREILKRTISTWGEEAQGILARLNVGIVGLGSVGCIVAESLARIGVSRLTLIDHDTVKIHNLDRLLYATERDLGKRKVDLAAREIQSHATADQVETFVLPVSIHEPSAYNAAIDCDVLFSCVDRPVGRDVLNYIAYAHLIPVIDGGVDAETLDSTHWRSHLVGPGNQCMRCIGQYTSSGVRSEREGLLDDPTYIKNMTSETYVANQNVFPFSLSVAAMELNMMLRHVIAPSRWPSIQQQDYGFLAGDIRITDGKCYASCEFPGRTGMGDRVAPPYVSFHEYTEIASHHSVLRSFLERIASVRFSARRRKKPRSK